MSVSPIINHLLYHAHIDQQSFVHGNVFVGGLKLNIADNIHITITSSSHEHEREPVI